MSIKDTIIEISNNFLELSKVSIKSINLASETIIHALSNSSTIFFCGNGGSAADAQHLAAELIGRYRKVRKPYKAIALTTDTSSITAIANDFSFDDIFSRQIQALGNKNDILYAISTSGESQNILNAISKAKEKQMTTIGITGANGGKMNDICDILVKVPSERADRIQEMHIAIGQILCEQIENKLC